MYKKLHIKLTCICIFITGLILSMMACGALFISAQLQNRSFSAAFQSDYNTILYYIQRQPILEYTWLAQTENENQAIIYLEDKGNPILFRGTWKTTTPRIKLIELAKAKSRSLGFEPASPPLSSLTDNRVSFLLDGDSKNERYRAIVAAIPTSSGWMNLILLKDMHEEISQANLQKLLFFGLVFLGIVLLAIFSWWFTGRAIKPIEDSNKKQGQFIASASHELRTPLAVIQTSTSAILKCNSMCVDTQSEHFFQAIIKECEKMSRLVDDLLLLARADAKNWSLTFHPLDIDTLLLTQSELFEYSALQKGIQILVILDEDETLPRILGDEQRLSQVIAILIDNAITYTPSGGTIWLQAFQLNNDIRVVVRDSGIGIEDSIKPYIFDRFFRADTSRSGKSHYGLGLSIAKEIIHLHYGKIKVENNDSNPGVSFIIDLPIRDG